MLSKHSSFSSHRGLTVISGLALASLVIMPDAALAIESNAPSPAGTIITTTVPISIPPALTIQLSNNPIPSGPLGISMGGLEAFEEESGQLPDSSSSRVAQSGDAYTRIMALISPLLAENNGAAHVTKAQIQQVRQAASDTIAAGNDDNARLKDMVSKDNVVVVSAVNPAIKANDNLKASVGNLIGAVGTLPKDGSPRQRVALATIYAALNDIVSSEEIVTPALTHISNLINKTA